MKKILFTFMLAFVVSFSVQAQYKAAIGLRGGLSQGITYKQMMGGGSAFEFIGATRWQGINLTVLYERQNSLGGVEGLYYFYGFGGHIGFWDTAYLPHGWYEDDESGSKMVIGGDAILGIEYCIPTVPISISVDWKPAFNFIGYSGFWGDNGAFSIRYTF
ncbi:MAG: hypothetical protein PF590_03590 [Candidatus Delongbacteria bacterium]|jgi:hypothetical protein|nr:hypothetical protein [Candidatus Delongbacteria bacterium]